MMNADLWLGIVRQAFGVTTVFAEVLVAAALFAHGQELKPHAPAKVLGACALVFACNAVVFGVGSRVAVVGTDAHALQDLVAQVVNPLFSLGGGLLLCTMTLIVVAILVRILYGLSGWAAVFCGTTGYALQNLGSGISETVAILADPGRSWIEPWMWLVTLGCCAATDLIVWWFFIRKIDPRGLDGKLNASVILMLLVVAFGVIGFDLILKYSVVAQLPRGILLSLRAFHALVCVFVIVAEVELVVVRQLSSEKAITEHLLAESERQYQLSRANMGAINTRIHDIRHDVLRTIYAADGALDRKTAAAIVREVEIYDTPVRTGNEALDVVLTEKSFLCRSEGITLTCVADGRSLAFMSPADLYTLFGSLLDVAMGHATGAGRDKQSISLVVKRRVNIVSIHLECYRDAAAYGRDASENDLSDLARERTRNILERYHGTIATRPEETNTLSIDVLFPQHSELT